ncbi:tyrosine-type recombinase/integrase [Hufsiella ginkgonis]|uniref:Tyrosine-type recombinase/integrase n=1 Tax=Hufsiella ginkgonis TaxID=2695274 RepID=A0A7K1Y2H6_9SPHI|nr:site-specific integrase [Hufsiella ginkgonis]MXV16886.1 tyrosine-type recombinase/integrase [Hufsiella ginkgonis]
MSNTIVQFTKANIKALPIPLQGRVYYRDAQLKGLSVCVLPTGRTTFYVIKKVNGEAAKIYLGPFPDLSIENARKQAQVKLSLIAQGINPQDQVRTAKEEMTLGELFEQYMSRYSKLHKKSWIYDEREIPSFVSHWFGKRISNISRNDVQSLHEEIFLKSGLYQANRMLERIRAMYNKAIYWGWQGQNPCVGIKKFKEKSRDRFVQPNEMPYFIRALNEEESQTIKDYLWLLLLTGARKMNTMMMRWDELNLETQEWRIPDTKNGDPLLLPLASQAVTVLKRRRETSKSDWVFPQDGDLSKHIVNEKRGWKRTLENATIYLWRDHSNVSSWLEEVERNDENPYHTRLFKRINQRAMQQSIKLPVGLMDIRLHDLRRTFGSYQAIVGASLQVIGRSLGHKSLQSTQIYARLHLDPIRDSIGKATQAMLYGSELSST